MGPWRGGGRPVSPYFSHTSDPTKWEAGLLDLLYNLRKFIGLAEGRYISENMAATWEPGQKKLAGHKGAECLHRARQGAQAPWDLLVLGLLATQSCPDSPFLPLYHIRVPCRATPTEVRHFATLDLQSLSFGKGMCSPQGCLNKKTFFKSICV